MAVGSPCNKCPCVIFEVLMAMKMTFFWVITLCAVVDSYQHFKEAYSSFLDFDCPISP
jgi:hypothetical protein